MRKLLTTVIAALTLAAGLAPVANAKRPTKPPLPTDPVPCICLPSPDAA